MYPYQRDFLHPGRRLPSASHCCSSSGHSNNHQPATKPAQSSFNVIKAASCSCCGISVGKTTKFGFDAIPSNPGAESQKSILILLLLKTAYVLSCRGEQCAMMMRLSLFSRFNISSLKYIVNFNKKKYYYHYYY